MAPRAVSLQIKRESITTCIKETKIGYGTSWFLYITSNAGSLEISQQLARTIYYSSKWKDIFNINAILTTSLANLESMYPLDCMPNLKYEHGVRNHEQ